MANTKPKKTATKSKTSNKAKTKSAKSGKSTKVVAEKKVGKELNMTAKNSEKSKKVVEKNVEAKKVDEIPFEVSEKEPGFFKTLFARKCDKNENILTIFKTKRIWGAILGEVVGTMLLSILMLTLGIYQPLYIFFAFIGLTLLTFGLSGANLNPLITASMMATRRMSAIRGILYIIAQIFGAWIGFLIVQAFVVATAGEGTEAADIATKVADTLPKMSGIETETFWLVTMIEFFGATIIGLVFVRALQYKRSALTFAMFVAGGIVFAFLTSIIISSNFAGLENNFALNPAIALMYQILPTTGTEISEILSDVAIALSAHVVFPILGGILGAYISDIMSVFNKEKLDM